MSGDELREVRKASEKDLVEMTNIYNEAIALGNATAHTTSFKPYERKDWFLEFDSNYPLYALLYQNKVIGYGSFSPYRKGRKALAGVAEITFYLKSEFHGQGHGSFLVNYMLNQASDLGYKSLLAILLDTNMASVHLLRKTGFERWGHFPNIVHFENRSCGQFIYGRHIE